ncbi:ligand-binding sensor domain-containing protein [Kordia jejudonensis]|uniref:ligand-binding sensor domain-containing protein n=1 Tax=Kordia jejudonensis TaxID=1348245 RepID=UPI00062968E1|nr:LytTR family transcriptional regulator DNA-binding domain-containing protein [Kordia jejudonensis]
MKSRQRATYLIILFYLAFFSIGFSQEYVFKNFDTQQGLPSSEVYNCFQDAKGKIWFLTDRGLSMYDSYSFQNFSTKDGLLDNTLMNFHKVSDSLVWISSLSNQLVLMNTNSVTFQPYLYNDNIKAASLKMESSNTNFNNFIVYPDQSLFAGMTMLRKIEIDRDGTVAPQEKIEISKQTNYIHFYASPKGVVKAYKGTKHDTLSLKNHEYIRVKSFNTVRFSAAKINDELSVIGEKDSLFLYKNGKIFEKKFHKNRILNIGQFYDNQFWVSYIGAGVDVFDENGNFVKHFLGKESISSLLIDHQQSLWATSLTSGVYYCKNPNLTFHKTSPANHIHSLVTKQNTLYVGTFDGHIFQRKGDSLVSVYNSGSNLPISLSANNIIEDVIFNNNNSTYTLFGKKFIKQEYVRGFSDDVHDSLYIFGGNPFVYRMTENKITPSIIEQSNILKVRMTFDLQLFEDKLLVGKNDGLYVDATASSSLYEGRVNDIDRFQDDFVIATAEKGVVFFKNYKPILEVTDKNGLYSNQITELLVENDSVVWACSNVGVNKIEIANDSIVAISGLSHAEDLGIEVNDVQIIRDTLWIGTKKGLYSYPTKKSTNVHKNKLPFFTLEEITVNNEERSKHDLKQLSYDENAIFIRYNCIAFNNSANLAYRYKFENQDWIYTKNREIRLNNVPAINTNFIIQAREGSNAWNTANQLILPIQITPAFWTTWWFKLLMAIAVGFLIYTFFKIRVLTYNKDIVRGLLMSVFNKIKTEKLVITIKSDGKHVKLFSDAILYVQSSGNYIEIFTNEKSFVTRDTIKSFHKMLPDKINYLQIHRSYLVRLDKISAHNYTSVTINELSIPIGKTYQKEVHKILLK